MINQNLKYLRELNGYKGVQMLDFVGIDNKRWSGYEKGRAIPPIPELLKIADFFGVDFREFVESDLSEGKIEPVEETDAKRKVSGKIAGKVYPEIDATSIVQESALARMPKVVTVDSAGKDSAVLVPVRARAGYLSGYSDPEYIEHLHSYNLPGIRGGTYRLFEVDGNSMLRTLHDKDVVVGQYVENLRQIREDRVHVIVTKEHGVVVKRCLNRIEKEGVVVLKSDNYRERDFYPTLVVYPEDILEVWYVSGYLSRQLPPPTDEYNRLNELEAQQAIILQKLTVAGL